MVAHGRVKNGVVVLDDGVQLPEGQGVTVLVPSVGREQPASEMSEDERLAIANQRDRADSSPTSARQTHSLLDIPAVSLGPILHPVDLLGEMLEGRE